MIPVLAGMCRFESLKDGTVDMADLALMHDALLVRSDNEEIVRRAEEHRRG